MEPSIHIRALDLVCPAGLDREGRRRLATVVTGELAAALARTGTAIDDGSLIFVRRLDVRARLRGGSDQAAAARWADAIAAALRDARGDIVVFEQPIDALVALVAAALGRRPAEVIGGWPWVPSVLEAIRAALSALPALDGGSRGFAAAPPLPISEGAASTPEPRRAIEWALVTSGVLLPSLVARLAASDLAAAALGAITAPVAAAILERLVGTGPAPEVAAPVVSRVAAAVTDWPALAASDPRNQLLVAALALEHRPSLRGTPALASVRAIEHPAAKSVADPAAAFVADHAAAVTPLAAAPGELAAIGDGMAPLEVAAVGPATAGPAVAGGPAIAHPIAAHATVAPAIPSPLPSASPDVVASASRLAGIATGFAGLLFVLDPVRRLELPAAILDEPALASDPGLPALLYATACRLIPDAWADPCALALTDDGAPQAPPTVPTPERLVAIDRAAARIAAAAAQLPATPHAGDVAEAAGHAAAVPLILPPWLDRFCITTAAQIAAHLRARLGSDLPLPALARKLAARPGTILVTRTHIDVTLDLADVDLDVRRAALDINPGWVSFLGRILSFHYR